MGRSPLAWILPTLSIFCTASRHADRIIAWLPKCSGPDLTMAWTVDSG